MSFIVYDLTFLVLFTLAVAIFIYIERKKMVRQGLLFLYRTSIGLKFMDRIGKKYPRTLKVLSYIVIFTGIVLMLASIYFIIELLFMFTNPQFVKLVKIPPITPLIPYLPSIFNVTWLPPLYFTYWIIAIALVAIFHEGFHGIFARFHNIRIKSSGFGFLGPFLAFFVEQDEKQMKKAKPFSQMSVLAAGVFANVLLTIVFVLIMALFFSMAYTPSGVLYNDYIYSAAPFSLVANATPTNEIINIDGLNFTRIEIGNNSYFVVNDFFKLNSSKINETTPVKLYDDFPALRAGLRGAIFEINGKPVKSQADIRNELNLFIPGDTINISTKEKNQTDTEIFSYMIKLGSDPNNSSRPVIGIATLKTQMTGFKSILYQMINFFRDSNVYYEPKASADFTEFIYNLLLWLVMINFGVALANMWPVAIFDGGYFFYLIVFSLTKSKKIAEKSLKISTGLFLAIIVLMMLFWAAGMFLKI